MEVYTVSAWTYRRVRFWLWATDVLGNWHGWAARHLDRDMRRLEADVIRSRWSR